MAEVMALQRDLSLLRYTGGKLHISLLSTAAGVALIRQAKAEGLDVTADVAAYQLSFTDEALTDFDTLLKVSPPFRSAEDRAALLAGLQDGTLDAVVSAHLPLDVEQKELEFDRATSGIIGLETAFASLRTATGAALSAEQLVRLLSLNPRRRFGLPAAHILPDTAACLTLFTPEEPWSLERAMLQSRSANSPFLGQQLTGRPLGVVRGARVALSAAFEGATTA